MPQDDKQLPTLKSGTRVRLNAIQAVGRAEAGLTGRVLGEAGWGQWYKVRWPHELIEHRGSLEEVTE